MIPKTYTVDVIYTVKVQASCAYEAEQKAIRITKEESVAPIHTEAVINQECSPQMIAEASCEGDIKKCKGVCYK